MNSTSTIKFLIFSLLFCTITCQDDPEDQEPEVEIDTHGLAINETVSAHIPYMASLRLVASEVNKTLGYGHFCGAVFVSRRHLVTLASCLDKQPSEIQIVAGTRYRYEEVSKVNLTAERFVIHSGYTAKNLPNNVAIIVVSGSSET